MYILFMSFWLHKLDPVSASPSNFDIHIMRNQRVANWRTAVGSMVGITIRVTRGSQEMPCSSTTPAMADGKKIRIQLVAMWKPCALRCQKGKIDAKHLQLVSLGLGPVESIDISKVS